MVSDRRSDTGVLNTLRSCGSDLRSDPTFCIGKASLLRSDVGVICRVAVDRDHREAVYKNDGLAPGLANGVGNDLQ